MSATLTKPLTQEELKQAVTPKKAEPVKKLNYVNVEALQLLADKYGNEAVLPRAVGQNFDILDYEAESNSNGLYPPKKVGKLYIIPKFAEWLDAQIENLMQKQFQDTAYEMSASLTEESRGIIPEDSELRVVLPFKGELAVIRRDTGSR